jgi:hypothetical protein
MYYHSISIYLLDKFTVFTAKNQETYYKIT